MLSADTVQSFQSVGFLLVTAALLAACGGPASSDSPPAEECLASVQREPPATIGPPLSLVTYVEVRAVTPSGCAPLAGPLVALNWFSFADREVYQRYALQVGDVLAAYGHRPLLEAGYVETLEAPEGRPQGGGAYIQEELAFAVYRSAGGFLDMLLSPEFQAIVVDQQAGARQEDYVWGLQRCLVGCAADAAPPRDPGQLFLAHIFRYEGEDLEGAVRSLAAAEGAPDIIYGGELVAVLQVVAGPVRVNPQNPPWGQGTTVFRVASREQALAWISSPAFEDFRGRTAEDVIVLVRSGGLGL